MTVTLANLRTALRQRTDRENSSFFSDSELAHHINSGLSELYDLLVESWEDYFLQDPAFEIVLEPGTHSYPLPDGRTDELAAGADAVAASGTARLTSTQIGDRVIIAGVPFTAVASGAGANQFVLDEDFSASASRLSDAINTSVSAGVMGVVEASVSSTKVTVTASTPGAAGNAIMFTKNGGFSLSPTTGTLSGGADAVPSTYYPAMYKLRGVDLEAGLPTPLTLKPFDFRERNRWGTAMIAYPYPFSYRYQILGQKIRFWPTPTSTNIVHLWYVPVCPLLVADTDALDFVIAPGWEDFIVASAAAKMAIKEEGDPSPFLADKMSFAQRVQAAAKQRVAGEPKTITDVRAVNWPYGDRHGGSGGDDYGNGGW